MTGSSSSIWKAVGAAKDLNPNVIPANLTVEGASVSPHNLAGAFASYFNNKVQSNVNRAIVNAGGVFNGKCKLIVQNINFMAENDVNHCLDDLNSKKCEGFDRIPVCMLHDACGVLLTHCHSFLTKFTKHVIFLSNGKLQKLL